MPSTPVHPRGCGERLAPDCAIFRPVGSSPRVRGTPDREARRLHARRFIPAGAGNASCSASRTATTAVHPRGCGERESPRRFRIQENGSSPRVRGTRAGADRDAGAVRFIPAGAGNARFLSPLASSISVHPRGCGERVYDGPDCTAHDGSSPRVRGTLSAFQQIVSSVRFIPAGAGNASNTVPRLSVTPVHPRGCGERVRPTYTASSSPGSSPRVRGTRGGQQRHHRRVRFIPAGAGNAFACRKTDRHMSVHPRGCGERIRFSPRKWPNTGSSPRVRGTRLPRRNPVPCRRFIPAGAGNARSSRRRAA